MRLWITLSLQIGRTCVQFPQIRSDIHRPTFRADPAARPCPGSRDRRPPWSDQVGRRILRPLEEGRVLKEARRRGSGVARAGGGPRAGDWPRFHRLSIRPLSLRGRGASGAAEHCGGGDSSRGRTSPPAMRTSPRTSPRSPRRRACSHRAWSRCCTRSWALRAAGAARRLQRAPVPRSGGGRRQPVRPWLRRLRCWRGRWVASMASLAIPVGRGRLLTVPETAKRLRVSTRTVLRLIERDELPSRQLGAQRGAPVRIDEAELLAWLYGDLGAAAWTSSSSSRLPRVAKPLVMRRRAPASARAKSRRGRSEGVELGATQSSRLGSSSPATIRSSSRGPSASCPSSRPASVSRRLCALSRRCATPPPTDPRRSFTPASWSPSAFAKRGLGGNGRFSAPSQTHTPASRYATGAQWYAHALGRRWGPSQDHRYRVVLPRLGRARHRVSSAVRRQATSGLGYRHTDAARGRHVGHGARSRALDCSDETTYYPRRGHRHDSTDRQSLVFFLSPVDWALNGHGIL